MTQRGGLGIDFVLLFADIGVPQNVKPFGIGSHDAVFDSVVHHLDEVSGADTAAMQVSFLGGSRSFLSIRRARDIAQSGSQGLENGIKTRDAISITTNQ